MRWKYDKYIGIALLSLLPACNDLSVVSDYIGENISCSVGWEEHPNGPNGVYKIYPGSLWVNGKKSQNYKPFIFDGNDSNSNYYGRAEEIDKKISMNDWVKFELDKETPKAFYPKFLWTHIKRKNKGEN